MIVAYCLILKALVQYSKIKQGYLPTIRTLKRFHYFFEKWEQSATVSPTRNLKI